MKVKFVGGSETDITVDSGAEESVCPWEWGEQFGIRDADRWLSLVNASGGYINHWGTRNVKMIAPF